MPIANTLYSKGERADRIGVSGLKTVVFCKIMNLKKDRTMIDGPILNKFAQVLLEHNTQAELNTSA